MQKVLHYAVKGEALEGAPKIIEGFQATQVSESSEATAKLVSEYGLTWEMVKPEHLNAAEVWEALLPTMPMNAMVRNLAKMTAVGLVKPMSEAASLVVKRLGNQEEIRKSRLHPLNILLAAKTYSSGHGLKGSLEWTPVAQVVDALDSAFDLAFVNAPVTGNRYFVGVDVSGSMSSPLPGKPIRCCEGSAALALFIARKEPQYAIAGFSYRLVDLGITAKDTIQSAARKALMNNFGGTDASLAIQYALDAKIAVDTFVVITDNETWAGRIHPAQALQKYRESSGIPAKLAVIGMTATEISIADPADAGMLDLVGFDASIPSVLADFAVH
jgi:60 kDa SS-A/Ro ribonucleoprotein